MGGALWPGTEPVKQLTILAGTLSARCSRAVEGKEREGEGERDSMSEVNSDHV